VQACLNDVSDSSQRRHCIAAIIYPDFVTAHNGYNGAVAVCIPANTLFVANNRSDKIHLDRVSTLAHTLLQLEVYLFHASALATKMPVTQSMPSRCRTQH